MTGIVGKPIAMIDSKEIFDRLRYTYDAGAEKVQQAAAVHNWQAISMQKDFHKVFAFE